jgi:hypothetical protein
MGFMGFMGSVVLKAESRGGLRHVMDEHGHHTGPSPDESSTGELRWRPRRQSDPTHNAIRVGSLELRPVVLGPWTGGPRTQTTQDLGQGTVKDQGPQGPEPAH